MLVVDSSVWIDFFRGSRHPAVEQLALLLGHGEVRLVVPDLVLYEVLRGFRHERDLRQASLLMQGLSIEPCVGEAVALAGVQHYRGLRAQGHTVRSSVDVLVAAFCIENDYALLHKDRDFDALETQRGLKVWTH
ncbi:type II toxin-antitoxin system VapC family toxin [Paucibacter soli]|uniref:type II toxin-antitoxin system VapC family toxin n=1 Tax=Paucibacter soli TaxID=3133433 RepID=UPI0030B64FF7